MLVILLLLLAVVVITIPSIVSQAQRIIRPLSSTHSHLSFSPTRLSGRDSATIILCIINKYMLKLISAHPKLLLSENKRDYILPKLSLSAPLLVELSDISRFNTALQKKNEDGFDTNNSPLFLPAVTTPMMLMLLSNLHCPILPFGSVNTKNRFEFIDPQACRNVMSLRDASVFAYVGGQELLARRVKRGVEADIVIEVRSGTDTKTDHASLVFRQVITVLQFLPEDKRTQSNPNGARFDEKTEKVFGLSTDPILLSSDTPTRWVAVCHDRNPIHTSSLMAKLFGFPNKIAHGNHVIAFVVENGKSGGCGEIFRNICWKSEEPFFLEVAFRRPMVLPINLEIRYEKREQNVSPQVLTFEVVKGEKVYITGVIGNDLE